MLHNGVESDDDNDVAYGSMGVIFKRSDEDNYYKFEWNGDSLCLVLSRMRNGRYDVLDAASESINYCGPSLLGCAPGFSPAQHVRISAIGEEIKVYVNNTLKLEASDDTHIEAPFEVALYVGKY